MLHRRDDDNPTTPDVLELPCFMCGRALIDECISWSGAAPSGIIALHITCALDLVLKVGRDVWQFRHELPKPH